MTAVYSAAHFLVDLACAYFIFGICTYKEDPMIMLTYNFCAFALQMPMGIILDRLSHKKGADAVCAAAGCMIISAVLILGKISGGGLLCAAAVGTGNAAFHIGGGTDILSESKSSSSLGIFVSPGAIGLYFGTVMGKSMPSMIYIIAAAMLSAAFLIVFTDKRCGFSHTAENPCTDSPVPVRLKLAAAILFIVVCIRSVVGFGISFEWKIGTGVMLAAVAAALGKTCGGLLSDKLGASAASAISAFSGAMLFIFGRNMICGLLAILLFNMSMPVTLRGAADIFGNNKGFSFGLLTFALFLGFIPVYAEKTALAFSPYILSAASVLSGILLLTALYLMKRRVSDVNNDHNVNISGGNSGA